MPQGSAINEILQMRQQGLSNNQIIQNLQRAGYSNTQIFDAMNQADTKIAVEGTGPMRQAPVAQAGAPAPPPQPVQQNNPPQMARPMAMQPASGAISISQEKVEELVEAVIEEKWTDLMKDINKIIDWKNRMEAKLTEMDIRINDVKQNVSDLNKAIVSKVNDYDKHILDVGADLKAMEQVFSKVLPTFTKNINDLSTIVDTLKGQEGEIDEE